MASIEIRDTKDGKRAYRFRTLIGKDTSGKRIFETSTWKPPEGLTAAKEKRLAETEAYRWEQQIKGGIPPTEQGAFTMPPAAAHGRSHPRRRNISPFRRAGLASAQGCRRRLEAFHDCDVWLYNSGIWICTRNSGF